MTEDATRRKAQFELERELRARILASAKEERCAAAAAAYGELFERFPDLRVLVATREDRLRKGRSGAGLIHPLTKPGDRVLEVGCGRGDVLLDLARRGCRCIGLEPAEQMSGLCAAHPNMHVAQGTAERLEFADESFDLVFSQQVLEHVHPDDVPEHFAEAFRVLRCGGILCVETPNRRTGPQDISRGFTRVAAGLHLKEWTVGETIRLFRQAGFTRVKGLLAPPFLARRSARLHRWSRVPAGLKHMQDVLLALVPGLKLRTFVARMKGLNDVFLFGRKPPAT
jgi:SAM-dependent methyltransferase